MVEGLRLDTGEDAAPPPRGEDKLVLPGVRRPVAGDAVLVLTFRDCTAAGRLDRRVLDSMFLEPPRLPLSLEKLSLLLPLLDGGLLVYLSFTLCIGVELLCLGLDTFRLIFPVVSSPALLVFSTFALNRSCLIKHGKSFSYIRELTFDISCIV